MYAMPEPIKTTLYLLGEAASGLVQLAGERCIAPISGVESTGQYGIDDLGDDPYAYLGRPGVSGAELARVA